jgi:hypothetical protein
MLKQHRSWNNVALVANEVFENLEFSRQQLDSPATAADGSRHEVEFKITNA